MTAPTITPTAIDALVHIESIWVTDRHRTDLGDLQELAKSIDDVGLLNPITLTREARLIAGQRRLEACRLLGWTEVPTRFIDSLDDASRLLRAERDENTCRKAMLPSEMASLGEALWSIEARGAGERQREAGDRGRATRHGLGCGDVSTTQEDMTYGKARDAVGEALGMSGRTYSELRQVYLVANDDDAPEDEQTLAKAALDKMDAGAGIYNAGVNFRHQLRAKRDAQDAKASAMAETEPEPEPRAKLGRTAKEAKERRIRIRELAARGYTSHQIGEQIGTRPVTVRKNAREHGITIPADEALGRSRKTIDSNRIVRETVQTVEDLGLSLKLVNYDELDHSQIGHWTASLNESIKTLHRLNKRLKEMVQ